MRYKLLVWPLAMLGLVLYVLLSGIVFCVGWLLFAWSPRLRRLYAGRWMTVGSALLMWLCSMCMRINIIIDEQPGLRERLRRDPIIISNHQNYFDILLICYCLVRLGIYDTLWMVKRDLILFPFVGWALFARGSVFLRSREDMERLKAGCLVAQQDRAPIVNFAEGTRFSQKRATHEFTHVLEPQRGGFILCCKMLGERQILDCSINWALRPRVRSAKDLPKLCGSTVNVRIELFEDTGKPSQMLRESFLRKNDWVKSFERVT